VYIQTVLYVSSHVDTERATLPVHASTKCMTLSAFMRLLLLDGEVLYCHFCVCHHCITLAIHVYARVYSLLYCSLLYCCAPVYCSTSHICVCFVLLVLEYLREHSVAHSQQADKIRYVKKPSSYQRCFAKT
jgi:hypothetical protein